MAVLPWRWRELAAGSWQYEQQEEPCFTVSAQRENSSLLRIHAQGRAGGMVRDVEVLASLRPFARQALIARQLWGQAITVVGHVAADEVVFRTDSSYIDGDLRAARLELQDGGSYHCTGYHWTQGRPYTLEVDFPCLCRKQYCRVGRRLKMWQEYIWWMGSARVLLAPRSGNRPA